MTPSSRPPTKTVYILGTRHDTQYPGRPHAAEFSAVVTAACRKWNIAFLGEEMNRDALGSGTTSVCKEVADVLSIPHCYCDPTRAEQTILGIANPGKASPDAFSPSCNYKEPDPEVSAADAIREAQWLNCLMEANRWPVLFVCGSHHRYTFQALLEKHAIAVEVVFRGYGWLPNTGLTVC